MRTTNFDAIAASAPLDAQASAVRDGSGDLWDAQVNTPKQWSLCPPLQTITESHTLNPDFKDITGQRFGRLVVRGMLDYAASGVVRQAGKGSAWVCRCDCGEFCGRYRKSLLSSREDQACNKCDHLKHIQWCASHPSTKASRAASADRLDQLARKFG